MSNQWEANLQILANAGSGKTHTLVTRIIGLLKLGVHPRRIIALTFTRKAAGEFLSKLLQRLAAASLDPEMAADLSRTIHLEGGCTEYQLLLRQVVQNLGKLQLTTLDSFFNRVVAAFPQELGLSGTPKLLDSHAEELAGRESLRHALDKLTLDEKNLLLQTLLERDEGSSPGSASRDLHSFRKEVHESFLDHPEKEAWGDPQRVWGVATNPWRALNPEDLQSSRNAVAGAAGSPVFSDKAQNAWTQLQGLTRGTKTNAVVSRIIESLDQWKAGTGSVLYLKISYAVSAEAQQAAAALVENYLHESTEYRLREARAVHHLLDLYETSYSAEVRERGMLTFSDVTNLLQPDHDFTGIGREQHSETSHLRLQLDERLDALFDHWLLDEFQDTSRGQYRALENILDEVISEAARGGERSFFCVGDIKQAIYGWRKGDSRLFDELYDRYKLGGGLKRESLNISWRSSEEVLATLNSIFGDLDASAPTLSEGVRQRWQRAWAPHQRTTEKRALPGYFSWITYEGKSEDERKLDMQERVVSLLQEVQLHLKQGMTIALLVRSGKEANEWLETLRFAGIEALSESNPPVGRDNPVAAAVRSALSLSVHPGDRFALNHLSMEPLRGIFFPGSDHDQELEHFIQSSAELLAEGGFSGVIEWLLERLSPLINDEFSKGRAAALQRAALKADGSDLTSMDDFLSLLDDYEEQGRSAPHAVQVMTIHKAKGLEYDMVVIPLPGRQEAIDSLSNTRIDRWQNQQGDPFFMKLPAEEIRNVPGNETFATAAALKKEEAAFEELCVWYVAMSRAKQALYVYSQEPKKIESDKCPNFPQMLATGLERLECSQNGGFQDGSLGNPIATLGDPKWHKNFHPKPIEPERDLLPPSISISSRAPALAKSRPSDSAHEILRGAQAFLENNATALGSEIHTFFESIDWLPATLPDSISPEAKELLKPCLDNPTIQELFLKPDAPYTLWREQRFDLLMDGLWISGCFDRVVIFRDAQGRAVSADLIDFKTDQGGREKLISNHRDQLDSYRRALSQILNLHEKKIRMILIQLRSSDPLVILA